MTPGPAPDRSSSADPARVDDRRDDDPVATFPASDPGSVSTDEAGALEHHLALVRERDERIGAFIHLAPEVARASVRRGGNGALAGVTIGIKDIFDTTDMPTGYGSPIYDGHRPTRDAAAVALLRRENAVILGKTATTEFAWLHPCETRNPRNLEHTPGGSSSGSAAGVAAGFVQAALGTQTGGSVIRPASYCGVVGYKATFGLIPTAGVKPLSWSLDTIGVFAAAVSDAALVGGVLTGLGATLPVIGSPRFGVYMPPGVDAVPGAREALEAACTGADYAGGEVKVLDVPEAFSRLDSAWSTICAYEGALSLAFDVDHHSDRLSPVLLDLIRRGTEIPAAAYVGAQIKAAEGRMMLADAFADCDAILTPSAMGEAPKGLGSTGDSAYNRVWTMLGVPCVSVPGLNGPNGLPIGVQVVGRRFDDLRTFAAAAWLMKVIDPANRRDET